MRIAIYGDSLTEGIPGLSFFKALECKIPEHALVNRGKRGDTVVSLFRRIVRDGTSGPLGLAILWVGVNDVLAKVSRSHAALKHLMRQPRAKDLSEFSDYYSRILKLIQPSADRILAVSPLLIGESLSNRWNRELGDVCEVIALASSGYAHYIDLRAEIAARWSESQCSDYIPKLVTRIAWDSLFRRTPAAVDKAASRRGLQFTLDGVHLNSTGVQVVAEVLRKAIERPA